jgi:hypothetical protein
VGSELKMDAKIGGCKRTKVLLCGSLSVDVVDADPNRDAKDSKMVTARYLDMRNCVIRSCTSLFEQHITVDC